MTQSIAQQLADTRAVLNDLLEERGIARLFNVHVPGHLDGSFVRAWSILEAQQIVLGYCESQWGLTSGYDGGVVGSGLSLWELSPAGPVGLIFSEGPPDFEGTIEARDGHLRIRAPRRRR